MTIKETIVEVDQKLAKAGLENHSLEAELLVAQSIKKEREFLLGYPELALNSSQRRVLNKLVARRLQYEPLAYLLGRQDFYNVSLVVDKRALIPRPETESLVELVLKHKPAPGGLIVDIGTGSGAIIIALAKNLGSHYQFIATDISARALSLAKANAKANSQSEAIEFIKSDLLKKLLKKKNLADYKELVVVTNLPYLSKDWQKELSPAQSTELQYEPASALFAGEDGFDLYRQLAVELKVLIKKFGLKLRLYCEIAPEQANLFSHSFAELGTVKLERDLTGRVRFGLVN